MQVTGNEDVHPQDPNPKEENKDLNPRTDVPPEEQNPKPNTSEDNE
jgi:hypothetical protein